MNITVSQVIYCNNQENIENYTKIEKQYTSSIVPHIGESIYNYMWNDNVETKIIEVFYDLDSEKCDICLEKRVTPLSKERMKEIAERHGWQCEIFSF